MDIFDTKIFGRKKFSTLLEEIYKNQKKREEQIFTLIQELKPLVQDLGDATLLVPLIKDYLDMGLKNDDQLIKMATIIQRVLNSNISNSNDSLLIPESEKEALMKEYRKLNSKDV